MIAKMKFINISGPQNDIDRAMKTYLNNYEIHYENAVSRLSNVHEIKPFNEKNAYKEAFEKVLIMHDYFKDMVFDESIDMSPKKAESIINNAYDKIISLKNEEKDLTSEIESYQSLGKQLDPILNLDFDIDKIIHFKHLTAKFGRISNGYYNQLMKYVYDNSNFIFYECSSDNEYKYGIYFTPNRFAVEVEALMSSFHFESIKMPDSYIGTPSQAHKEIDKKLKKLNNKLNKNQEMIKSNLDSVAPELNAAYMTLKTYNDNFSIRKMAACTENFYILCGWMDENDVPKFLEDIKDDPKIHCVIEGAEELSDIEPPTKLNNPKIFKPFEMFVKMYGLPSYKELDPTIFVAITYTLMFGIMFGDVGQGLILAIGGFLLYKIKHMDLAGIISIAGLWSTFFGFMYGSIFGFEDWIDAVWQKPMNNIMTTLLIAIGFGMALILIAMVLRIVNGIREGEVKEVIFDQSGLAGLVVYGSVIICIALWYTGHDLPAKVILVLLFGIPLIMIFLKEPLIRLFKKQKPVFEHGLNAMFFVEAFVELFDVVLSYMTNTISFVRVGAFALSHAGMMGVVMTLAGVESGNANIIVIVLGNILVAGLEGLVVGIQVLRLEYYEMFSRFYKGTGKQFKSYKELEM